MPIYIEKETLRFHLQGKTTSYLMQVVDGYLVHLYWGKKIRHEQDLSHVPGAPNHQNLDLIPQEYPQYGSGDFREPAYQVQLTDGTRITELVYSSYEITEGKPALDGLPAVYSESDEEAQTLTIELKDVYTGLSVFVSYSVFHHMDSIIRSVRYEHKGKDKLRLLRALSMSVDMNVSDYEFVYLSGAWAREANIVKRPLGPGSTRIESKRGMSSHQLNPFMALASKGTNEAAGEVYGFSLVYSGNFIGSAELDPQRKVRIQMGINPFDFDWVLSPGESFQTPEVVMVYSSEGLGGMSRTYHKLYRTRLARGKYRDKERPILVNNWEATYFNFTADKIEDIAKAGAELGIELFVLDDGWFGKRNDDTTSLGDWTVDRNKLPNGLTDLAEKINQKGLQFGLWVEPEMVSPDSDLYRIHPDWCLHVEGRRRTLARTQLVLDLSRTEVREYLYQALSDIFESVPISYIKWDMNRGLSEIASAAASPEHQGEIAHRYVLGLYDLLAKLTTKFPHILFESCASGGGRFDPGMLYYMPQTWTSDNTDAVERLKIQYGTSLVYPASAIGAHVSAVPNHQLGRSTSLSMRGNVAMSGNFGYELDLTKFSEEEKEEVRDQVAEYKRFRSLVQQGDQFRLLSPFEGNEASWMFVSADQSEAILFYFKVLAEPYALPSLVKLQGLDPNASYHIEGKGRYGGDLLMNVGLTIPVPYGDFGSHVFYMRKDG